MSQFPRHAIRNLHAQGQLPEPEQCRQPLPLDPASAEAAFLAAVACKDQGRLTEALLYLHKALAAHPHFPEALNVRAIIKVATGDTTGALDDIRQALRFKPDYAEAHHNLGVTLARANRLDDAVTSFRQALWFKPGYGEAYLNLARALEEQGKLDEALAAYDKAVQHKPRDAAVRNALGLLFARSRRTEEAAAAFQQAVRLDANHAGFRNNLGVALSELGRPAECLEHFEAAVRLSPEHVEAHKSRAMAWLHLGDYERGWAEYEWRVRCKDHPHRAFRQPPWDGCTLKNKRILLYTEQGTGDIFQFVRYAPMLTERGATVLLECPAALVSVLLTCPGIAQIVPRSSPFPDFEFQAPLMSLPRLLGTTLANVPANIPYLFADESLVARWRQELSTSNDFKVGVVWQGNPKHGTDHRRSFPLRSIAPLARVPGVQLYSLQKGKGTEQFVDILGEFPVIDLGSRLDFGGFMVTAAAMSNLDLVVSCDTSCLHLAGALGRPVWAALSYANEWRWLQHRDDSPWYPTMRLFRQSQPGDWDGVFERMAAALRQRVQ